VDIQETFNAQGFGQGILIFREQGKGEIYFRQITHYFLNYIAEILFCQ
jgi:hypothetical protein